MKKKEVNIYGWNYGQIWWYYNRGDTSNQTFKLSYNDFVFEGKFELWKPRTVYRFTMESFFYDKDISFANSYFTYTFTPGTYKVKVKLDLSDVSPELRQLINKGLGGSSDGSDVSLSTTETNSLSTTETNLVGHVNYIHVPTIPYRMDN